MNSARRAFLWQAVGLAVPMVLSTRSSSAAAKGTPEFNVRAHGAKGDGRANDSRGIQAAIDAAGQSGGTVYFPAGEYLSGSLHLRSRLTLRLDAGATLIASPDDADFDPIEQLGYKSFSDPETRDFRFALLQGLDLAQVSILGPGKIDGNRTRRGGPKPIALKRCRTVVIRDVTIVSAPNYNISLLGCDAVDIRGVTILKGYSDGIDPDCCQNVRITSCRIESADDAIVLKSSFALGVRRATLNVTVTNCHLTTVHNGLKLGTESTGDFKNIVFRNCTVVGRTHPLEGDLSCGVAIETVDGGTIDRVSVSDIRMTNVRAPIFVRLGQRGRAQDVPAAGALRNIAVSNVVAVGAMTASSITGIPGYPVSEISLRNIRITAKGEGRAELVSKTVPELEKTYPDAYMFKDLPAYGLYCRHVLGLTLDEIELSVDRPDARPAVVLDDVGRARVRALRATPPGEGEALLWLRSVRDCVVRALRPGAGTKAVVRLSGADTTGVYLDGNDFSQAETVVVADAEVAASAFRVGGNVMPGKPAPRVAPKPS
jgi:hypothetical protein